MTQSVDIDKIEVGERHRQSLGDIHGLAESIRTIGLLHPITVTPEMNLVAGERRLAAFRLLAETDPAYNQIPVCLFNSLATLQAEADENTCRRDFTPSEAVAIGARLEEVEREKARERQSEAGKKFGAGKIASGKLPEAINTGRTHDKVGAVVGMGRRTYEKAKKVVATAEELDAPELVAMMDGRSVDAAWKEAKRRRMKDRRDEIAQAVQDLPKDERWQLWNGSLETWQAPQQYDFIITDPPYPRKYVHLYGVLALQATKWLKPGGLLVAMAGQSYMNEIIRMMSEHLDYYWTGCYYTPGQPTPLRQRMVNTTWKPLLMFTRKGERYRGKIFGDVFVSPRSEKNYHPWQQSAEGMKNIVQQICLPGQSVLDPFCGSGTTGIAVIQHGCTFHGLDVDEEIIATAQRRLHDTTAL